MLTGESPSGGRSCVYVCVIHTQGSDLELHKPVLGTVILLPGECAIGHLENVT